MAQIYKLFNINTLKNTIVIFEKHVRVSEKSHSIRSKSVHENIR